MTIPADQLELYTVLQRKRNLLFEYIVRLQSERTLANESLVLHKVDVARWEKERVEAVMSDIRNNALIAPPDGAVLGRMEDSIEGLQRAVARSQAATELIEAGDALIDAWPNA